MAALTEEIDWASLSESLSPDVLRVLREHMEQRVSEEADDDSSGVRDRLANSVFKDVNYWNERFAEEKSFEWLLTFDQLKPFILPYLKSKDLKILVIGCGNSSFSADLYDCGYTNITNIDFSEVVIQRMCSEHKESRPSMSWICMDMTAMDGFETGLFDVVIDKATMDALMVDEGDVWNPKQEVVEQADRMCLEISRVLKSDGVSVQLSFAQPHFRTKYLMASRVDTEEAVDYYRVESGYCARYGWTLSYETIDLDTGSLPFFLFVQRKGVETV